MIRLRTLGECVIEIDGESYGPDYDVLFAGLVYLTAERGRQVPRVVLAELLWPHIATDRARHNLRQLLYRLRIAGVTVDGAREHVMLSEHIVAATFSAAPAPERLVAERTAGTLVIGAFLPGYDPPFSDPFAEWVERTRATTEARVRRVLLEVAQAHRLRGEWDQVEALTADCLRLDPLNEEATLVRAEAIAMAGGKNDAVRLLDRFIEELGPTTRPELKLPATVLRRRIAERFPTRRYAGPSERCFVGRSALMETLSTALLRARNGEGNAVMLTGAPGIGKTRLVHEVTKIAVMHGVRVVRAGIDEADLQRPMAAFVEAVPQLRALPGAIGVSPDAIAFLERLTEVHRPSEPIPEEPRDPRWIAGRIRQAIVDLCDAVSAEGTLLLVIEDVHWLDSSSWASVAALLDWVPLKRALILMTSRGPHPTPNTPRRCVEKLAVLPVTALPRDAADAFVRAIVADHGGSLSDGARAWCVEVGEGNPLFLRELVIHCLEGGATHAVPPSLKGLLDARIARLGPIARRLLDAIAILGDHSTVELLSEMLALPAHEFASAIADLAESMLLGDLTSTITLRHELVRARVLSVTPKQVERFLHRKAAQALTDPVQTSVSAERLIAAAGHWQAAGADTQALSALLAAATAMQRVGEYKESIQVLEHALIHSVSRTDRADVLRRLAQCLQTDGQWNRVALVVSELIQLTENATGEARARDELLAIEAAYRTDQDPRRLISRAEQLVRDASLDLQTRLLAARCGLVIASNIDTDSELRALWPSIATILETVSSEQSERLELEVIRHAQLGELADSIRAAEALGCSAAHVPDPLRRLSLLSMVADAYRVAGLESNARSAYEVAFKESQRLGSRSFELRALQNMTAVVLDMGGRKEGEDLLRLTQERLAGMEEDWHHHASIGNQARAALLAKRYDEAQRLAIRYFESVTAARHPLFWFVRSAVTLLAEVLIGSTSDPIDPGMLEELLRVHKVARSWPQHDRTVAVLWLALKRVGREAEGDAIVAAYLERYRRSLGAWRHPSDVLRTLLQP